MQCNKAAHHEPKFIKEIITITHRILGLLKMHPKTQQKFSESISSHW